MTNRFMISVAALALVAGTGLANTQGTSRDTGGAAGAQQPTQQQPAQHAQPSGGAAERGGAMTKEKGTVGQAGGAAKSGAEEKSSGAMKDERSGTMNKNAADEKAGATKGERAQGQQDKSKSLSSDSMTKSGSKDMKAEDNKAGSAAEGNNAENRPAGATGSTVGQAGASAKLSTEQRTQITSVIREEKVAPATNVNFNISVGTRVPHEGITLHVLPSRVVTIYPEWRSYKYILVRDEIVIIDPNTYEIVAVLNA
jgi:hypothetical protein